MRRIRKVSNTMSDQDALAFEGADDAKVTIGAAVRYLLKGATASDRDDVVAEIIKVVRQAVHEAPPDSSDPFEDELPGG